MNRITQKLDSRCRHKLLVPFFTVGYPDLKSSLDLVRVGIDAGADFIELGMPFSDPMADGPDIQLSSQVALKCGSTHRDVFGVVRSVRKRISSPRSRLFDRVLRDRNVRFVEFFNHSRVATI